MDTRKTYGIKIQPQEYERFESYRWEKRLTKSEFIRIALVEYMQNHPIEEN